MHDDNGDCEAESLERLVERFRVIYEVSSAWRIIDGERRAIGFDVTLCGTHPDNVEHVLPGCTHCKAVWMALGRIAQAILPPADRDSQYSIRGFDRAFHMAAARGYRNDLERIVEIRHRDGYLESVDDCERQCLNDMKTTLEALGVPFRVWRE